MEGINVIEEEKESGEVTSKDILKAALRILFWIAVIFIFAMSLAAIEPQPGCEILDTAKTVLPPLAALIIAFYFNNKNDC